MAILVLSRNGLVSDIFSLSTVTVAVVLYCGLLLKGRRCLQSEQGQQQQWRTDISWCFTILALHITALHSTALHCTARHSPQQQLSSISASSAALPQTCQNLWKSSLHSGHVTLPFLPSCRGCHHNPLLEKRILPRTCDNQTIVLPCNDGRQ